MLPKIIFIDEEDSDFIKNIEDYFDEISSIEIKKDKLLSEINSENTCFVSTMSDVNMFTSDSDTTYSAMFPESMENLKKQTLMFSQMLMKNKILPEIIDKTFYLPVGSSLLIPIYNSTNYIIGSPDLSFKKSDINSEQNYYYVMKAILKCIKMYNLNFKNKIKTIVIPNIISSEFDIKKSVKELFNAYFDIFIGLDKDKPIFSSSNIYFFRAPLMKSYSLFKSKKIKNNSKIEKKIDNLN